MLNRLLERRELCRQRAQVLASEWVELSVYGTCSERYFGKLPWCHHAACMYMLMRPEIGEPLFNPALYSVWLR